ncbi:MAG: maltose acetyltransferase domain-containing protein, partial [Aeromonas veronii]
MSEYQKMISSQPYNCMAPELAQLRREAARRYRRFNQAEEEAEQRALLAVLIGKLA